MEDRGAVKGDSFSPQAAQNALNRIDPMAPLSIYINSGGGDADAGIAIYHILKRHKGHKRVVVMGLCASAAFTIAMAGDEIIMYANTLAMMHTPYSHIEGDAASLRRSAGALQRLEDAMAAIYAQRSGAPIEHVRQMMLDETWFTSEEAVAAGYADRVCYDIDAAASITGRTLRAGGRAFDLQAYTKVPALNTARKPMAKRKGGTQSMRTARRTIRMRSESILIPMTCPECGTEFEAAAAPPDGEPVVNEEEPQARTGARLSYTVTAECPQCGAVCVADVDEANPAVAEDEADPDASDDIDPEAADELEPDADATTDEETASAEYEDEEQAKAFLRGARYGRKAERKAQQVRAQRAHAATRRDAKRSGAYGVRVTGHAGPVQIKVQAARQVALAKSIAAAANEGRNRNGR